MDKSVKTDKCTPSYRAKTTFFAEFGDSCFRFEKYETTLGKTEESMPVKDGEVG